MYGGLVASTFALPDRPVRVGEAWQTSYRLLPDLPGSLAREVRTPVLTVRFTHTLQALQTKNGRQYAIIRTEGAGLTPPESPVTVQHDYAATTRFDVARGVVVSGQYRLDITTSSTRLDAGGNSRASQQDNSVTLTVMEVPAAAAAAGKKRRKR
jgi:hypothetical protein